MMTPEGQRTIRESWSILAPRALQLSLAFYERLLEIEPAAHSLFAASDMDAQRAKFVMMLAELVRCLDQPQEFVSETAALGSRHSGYGVTNRHYETVGAALIWSIEATLGERSTPEISAAWRELYTLVADVMQRGASRRPAMAPPG